jgi:hypothetical protein
MNQKIVLIRLLGAVVIGLVVLFPPWLETFTTNQQPEPQSASAGYHALWHDWPEIEAEDERENVAYRVNLVRLGIQLGAVLIVLNLALFAVKTAKRS